MNDRLHPQSSEMLRQLIKLHGADKLIINIRRIAAQLTDPHERECASAAIAARIEGARTRAEKRDWIAFRKDMLGRGSAK